MLCRGHLERSNRSYGRRRDAPGSRLVGARRPAGERRGGHGEFVADGVRRGTDTPWPRGSEAAAAGRRGDRRDGVRVAARRMRRLGLGRLQGGPKKSNDRGRSPWPRQGHDRYPARPVGPLDKQHPARRSPSSNYRRARTNSVSSSSRTRRPSRTPTRAQPRPDLGAEFAANQWIDELPAKEFPLDKMIPAVVKTGDYFGKQYAIPFNTNAGLLFYRKDLSTRSGPNRPRPGPR